MSWGLPEEFTDETYYDYYCQLTGSVCVVSSGGGQSYVEPIPAYQAGVESGGRGVPDVSYDADSATGVAVYDSSADDGQTGWFQVGGAPSWAAILASADQLRTAAGEPVLTAANDDAQRAVYASADRLSQIESGSNGDCPQICTAVPDRAVCEPTSRGLADG